MYRYLDDYISPLPPDFLTPRYPMDIPVPKVVIISRSDLSDS